MFARAIVVSVLSLASMAIATRESVGQTTSRPSATLTFSSFTPAGEATGTAFIPSRIKGKVLNFYFENANGPALTVANVSYKTQAVRDGTLITWKSLPIPRKTTITVTLEYGTIASYTTLKTSARRR